MIMFFFDVADEVGLKLNWNNVPIDLVDALITYHCHLQKVEQME